MVLANMKAVKLWVKCSGNINSVKKMYLGKIKNVPKEIRRHIHDTYGWRFCFVIIRGCPRAKWFRCNLVVILREIVLNLHWRTIGILIALYDE